MSRIDNSELTEGLLMKYFLLPGDVAASVVGLEEGSEHRQIFRMFINTVVWGLIGVVAAFTLAF